MAGFDVFLCHNSIDKAEVKKVGIHLRELGLAPWLDEWNLMPGLPWQIELENQIENIKSVAVFVGENGIGPWHNVEIRAFISEFVERGCPVIPVILPNCTQTPKLPIFLKGFTWVDFRKNEPDPISRLVWGITKNPTWLDERSKESVAEVKISPEIEIVPKNLPDASTSLTSSLQYNTFGNTGGNIVNRGLAAKQGGWIFYRNGSDGNKLYKIKTDGTSRYKLIDDSVWYINVVGEWVFYRNSNYNGKLYRIKTDGTYHSKVTEDNAKYINIVGEWIFYSNDSDKGKLYKIKTDGTSRTKLTNDRAVYINVVREWIFYRNTDDSGKLYKIKTDGTSRSKLNDDSTLYINVGKRWNNHRHAC